MTGIDGAPGNRRCPVLHLYLQCSNFVESCGRVPMASLGTQSDKVARLLPEGDATRFGIFA